MSFLDWTIIVVASAATAIAVACAIDTVRTWRRLRRFVAEVKPTFQDLAESKADEKPTLLVLIGYQHVNGCGLIHMSSVRPTRGDKCPNCRDAVQRSEDWEPIYKDRF